MTTTTQTPSVSIWKKAYTLIKSLEDASQYSHADRAVIRLEKKVSELEDTIRDLNNWTH